MQEGVELQADASADFSVTMKVREMVNRHRPRSIDRLLKIAVTFFFMVGLAF
jgi:hypothetical protein